MTSKSIREATPTPNQTMTPKSDSSALTVTIDDPNGEVATGLINDLCSELSARYGTPPSPFSPDEALAPGTAFVVARLGGQPIGCGALRRIDEATAEVKRMYVAPDGRRRGIARRILHVLEQLAAGFNYRAIRLETGVEQPEAISLYESSGYHRIAAYGHHTGDSLSVCFEKAIPPNQPMQRTPKSFASRRAGGVKSTFDFMKQASVFAVLAPAIGGSDPSC